MLSQEDLDMEPDIFSQEDLEMAKLAVLADRMLAREKEKRLLAEMQLAFEKEKCQAAEEKCATVEARILAGEKKKRLAIEMQLASEKEKTLAVEMQLACEKEKCQAAEEKCATVEERILAGEKKKRLAIEMQLASEKEKTLAVVMQLTSEKEKRRAAESKCAALEGQVTALEEQVNDLKSQMKMQKSTCGLGQGSFWHYKTDRGWEAFAPEGNEMMHQAYLDYLGNIPLRRYAIIDSGGVSRTVDFERMEQQHSATGTVRKICLSAGVPPEWVTPPAHLLLQGSYLESFYIEVTDQAVWDAVRNILRNTGHAWDASTGCSCMSTAEIKSVHRIENFYLWHRYKARLATMRQDHARYGISAGSAELDLDGPGNIMAESQKMFDCGEELALDVDEKILLHGTSWNNADAIVREGFDHRTCWQGMYGAGVYFACAACKSHQYTCEHNVPGYVGERTLIIARVALGDAYETTETRRLDRRAPVRSYACGIATGTGTHDSTVVKPGVIKGHHKRQIHQEFVIFDREQAYPCYVVQYNVG